MNTAAFYYRSRTVSNTTGNNMIIRRARVVRRIVDGEARQVMPELPLSNDRWIDRVQGGRGSILIRGSILNAAHEQTAHGIP